MNPEVDVHISRDNIRFALLNEKDAYFQAEAKVKEYYFQQIEECTNSNEICDDVYIDATHLTPQSRAATLKHINKSCYTVAIVFHTNLSTALERNKQRTGRSLVPDNVICRMYGQFVVPTFKENFDEIWHVYDSGEIRKDIKNE
jgi:predicted kinase